MDTPKKGINEMTEKQDKTWTISPKAHKKLSFISVECGKTKKELAEIAVELLEEWAKSHK